jgi:hypothetical protein
MLLQSGLCDAQYLSAELASLAHRQIASTDLRQLYMELDWITGTMHHFPDLEDGFSSPVGPCGRNWLRQWLRLHAL